MAPEDILVIGAGPAGLAVSACLRREGLGHVVLEREGDVGASWRQHYDRLHLHTTKTHSGLPMMPWPKSAPRYPSREQMVRYLQAYAQAQQVAPRLGVAVQRLRRSGDRFVVETSAGAMAPRVVVVATGNNRVPRLPSVPGQASFRGLVMHSSRYRDAAPCRGLRTLVVGCGNSGAEIALDLAEQGVDVAMVVRGPAHVVPRDMFGQPSQHIGLWLAHLPLALRDAIAGAALNLAVGDLSRWGIVRPAVGPNRMIEVSGRIPMLDIGTIDMVKRGKIRILPALHEIRPDGACFADGSEHPFEAIVWATGYTPDLGRLVVGFEAIADSRGSPQRFGEEAGIAGLYFVGFRNPATGALREIGIEAARAALSIRIATGSGKAAAGR